MTALPMDCGERAYWAVGVGETAAGMLVGAIGSCWVSPAASWLSQSSLVFGADIRTAGTARVLISLPVVVTGVLRHCLTGHYRWHSVLTFLVLLGDRCRVGGYLAARAPTDALRLALAAILAVSSLELWSKGEAQHRN